MAEHHVSGTVHHILWFLVHMCKMIISPAMAYYITCCIVGYAPANYFIFQSFDFGVF